MANLTINNGGIIVNSTDLPNIDLRYGPYGSIQEAYEKLEKTIAPGLTIGIFENDGITEYIVNDSYQLTPKLKLKTINDQPITGEGNINIEGITDYSQLSNKPSINGNELNGNIELATPSDLEDKQDELVSGTNIKTINNQSILGSGNISIEGITDYSQLSNKPKINNIELGGNVSLSDLGVATETDISELADKVDKLPTGRYYGQYDSIEELPDQSQLPERGYAYVSSTEPNVYYIYLYNGNGEEWQDSGNKFVTTELESNLTTKSQTKAPTTKAVADGIDSVNLLEGKNLTTSQKTTARENIGAQETLSSGDNIKTINNEPVLGTGNIIIQDITTPRTSSTELTITQKYNASANINDRPVDEVIETGVVKALGYKVLNPELTLVEQVTNVPNTIFEIKDEFDSGTVENYTTGEESVILDEITYYKSNSPITIMSGETIEILADGVLLINNSSSPSVNNEDGEDEEGEEGGEGEDEVIDEIATGIWTNDTNEAITLYLASRVLNSSVTIVKYTKINFAENCTLKFNGGQIKNCTLVGNNTKIIGESGLTINILFKGSYILEKEISPTLFGLPIYTSESELNTTTIDAAPYLFKCFELSNVGNKGVFIPKGIMYVKTPIDFSMYKKLSMSGSGRYSQIYVQTNFMHNIHNSSHAVVANIESVTFTRLKKDKLYLGTVFDGFWYTNSRFRDVYVRHLGIFIRGGIHVNTIIDSCYFVQLGYSLLSNSKEECFVNNEGYGSGSVSTDSVIRGNIISATVSTCYNRSLIYGGMSSTRFESNFCDYWKCIIDNSSSTAADYKGTIINNNFFDRIFCFNRNILQLNRFMIHNNQFFACKKSDNLDGVWWRGVIKDGKDVDLTSTNCWNMIKIDPSTSSVSIVGNIFDSDYAVLIKVSGNKTIGKNIIKDVPKDKIIIIYTSISRDVTTSGLTIESIPMYLKNKTLYKLSDALNTTIKHDVSILEAADGQSTQYDFGEDFYKIITDIGAWEYSPNELSKLSQVKVLSQNIIYNSTPMAFNTVAHWEKITTINNDNSESEHYVAITDKKAIYACFSSSVYKLIYYIEHFEDYKYLLTTGQPSNWKTNYMDYFTKIIEYSKVSSYSDWEENKYYSFDNDSGVYTLTTEEPNDWGTNYMDYYFVESVVYSAVSSDSTPTWEVNKYYYSNPNKYYLPDSNVFQIIDKNMSVYRVPSLSGMDKYRVHAPTFARPSSALPKYRLSIFRNTLPPSNSGFINCVIYLITEEKWYRKTYEGWVEDTMGWVPIKSRGLYSEIPTLEWTDVAKEYFATDRNIKYIWDGKNWIEDLEIIKEPEVPTVGGQYYFNQTLNKPLYWSGLKWVDADGFANDDRIGNINNRPLSPQMGFCFIDTNIGLPIFWTGNEWITASGEFVADNSGSSLADRLALIPRKGQQFKQTINSSTVNLIYGDYGWLNATDGTPWFDDSGELNTMYDKYNYILLTAQPDDWTTKYNTYYKIVDGAYTLLTTSETWAPDTYYKKDTNAYKGIQVKLTDTDTELLNMVVKWDGTKFINVIDNDALKAGTPGIVFSTENDVTTVTITSTSNGKIYYTKDGTDPTSSSTEYNNPITLSNNDQIKAICIRDHMDDSNIGFVKVATPSIDFSSTGILSITCDTPDVKIYYYTTNGSTPTTASTEYNSSESITIAKGTTVNAFAVLIGRVNSEVATQKRS